MPGKDNETEITHTYGLEEAQEVLQHSISDYQKRFDNLGKLLY